MAFVILTWNSQQYIEACVRSIWKVDCFDKQIIVVDNASADDTQKILARLQKDSAKTGRLETVFLPQNYGTSRSRNIAFARVDAGTAYICVLDSDTVVNGPAISALAAHLDNHLNCGLVGPRLVTSGGMVQPSARNFPTLAQKLLVVIPLKKVAAYGQKLQVPPGLTGSAKTVEADCLMAACWMLRPGLLQKTGPLDEKIFYAPEDVEFCIRVHKAGYRVCYLPGVSIIHEWQRISRKKLFSKHNWEHIKGLAYLFAKHRYLFSARRLKRKVCPPQKV